MNDNILIPFIISLLAGLFTLVGCVFIFVKPKNINKFIGVSLAFSATIMILISILELVPDGFFYLKSQYGNFYAILMLILMIFIGYLLNLLINNKITKSKHNTSNLYRVGVLSMIALMIHNLPEGIITFLTATVNIKLGLKLSLAIMMHNIPEGIAIAIPLFYSTKSKFKAMKGALISGLSEPFGALLAYLFLYRFISNTLISVILLFVAGIMIAISINDIFEEAKKYSGSHMLIGIVLGIFLIVLTEFIL